MGTRTTLLVFTLLFALTGQAAAQDVLVWSTGNPANQTADIATWIEASGSFASVDSLADVQVDLATLQGYDAVLFFTNSDGAPAANGDTLADYLDGGGALVIMTFSWANQGNNTIGGRFITDALSPFVLGGGSLYTDASLADTDGSSLWDGVASLTASYRDDVSLDAGATLRGSWTDGHPLAATKGGCLALSFFPDEFYGDLSGDHRALVVNALIDASGGGACTGDAPNGVVEDREECDDGDIDDTDDCTSTCRAASCGDEIVHAGVEECDDGNADETDACSSLCLGIVCGDGRVDGVEVCDDGNLEARDGCSGGCAPEVGFDCDAAEPTVCTAHCGDALVRGDEECDDGNQEPGDGCDDCVLEGGDGDGDADADGDTDADSDSDGDTDADTDADADTDTDADADADTDADADLDGDDDGDAEGPGGCCAGSSRRASAELLWTGAAFALVLGRRRKRS